MHRVAAQRGIIFFDFQLFRFQLFIPRRGVAGRRLAFLARFRAFDGDGFPCHKLFFFFDCFLFFRLIFIIRFHIGRADGINGSQGAEAA